MSTDETARSDAGHTAEDAVREMEEQLKPTDPAAPHAPPLREEYGGPRHGPPWRLDPQGKSAVKRETKTMTCRRPFLPPSRRRSRCRTRHLSPPRRTW
jgi:hypothetical protein